MSCFVDDFGQFFSVKTALLWLFDFENKGSPSAQTAHVNVLSSHAVEGVFCSLENLQHRVANEVLNALFVLQAGVVTTFASSPLAGSAGPAGLGDASFQFSVAAVDVDGPHVKFDREGKHVDECQDVGLVVDQGYALQSALQALPDFLHQ